MQRILIPLFFVFAFSLNAQIQSRVFVDGVISDDLQLSDSVMLMNHLNKIQMDWVNQGFFFAGIDSVHHDQSITSIYLHKGEKVTARLDTYKGKKLQAYISKQLKSYSNRGYPFATVRLDSAVLENTFLNGKILVEPGPEINYDSAYFFSKLKTNHSYIYQLLDIVPGDPFSERNYQRITQKIDRSPFLNIRRPTDLSFTGNKAKTFLDVAEDASSTFQGVIGLQQVQNGKTTAVGTLELDIQNLFRSGKQFRFAWERFAEESQSLNVFYKHPFFLDSKISPSFSFDLLKQDTTFLTRKTGLGIHTYVAPRVEIFFEYEATNGTLLSTNLETVRNSGLADFKRRIYSVKLSKGHLSSLGQLNQTSVWNLSASGGRKNIQRNLSLPDTYYDSIQMETNYYRLEATFAYQLKVLKRQAFFQHISVGRYRMMNF